MIIRADALALPLPDTSVDLVCTSPPYFGLRSYQDDGQHYAGQIGSEATPAEFVDVLIAATREMVRVLKPSGSIFVNLGDRYANRAGGKGWGGEKAFGGDTERAGETIRRRTTGTRPDTSRSSGIAEKSLIGVPWRYALRCIDELGLILRAEIIWAKPNGLPESVTDRVRRSHEVWFHFTREPRYYSAVDEIREGYEPSTMARAHLPRLTTAKYASAEGLTTGGATAANSYANNPLGKLPGSVWTVPTQPLTVPPEVGVDHFAAFPMEWPRRIIQGWSPSGVCTVCGEGRRPVVARDRQNTRPLLAAHALHGAHVGDDRRSFSRGETEAAITGYACGCPEPTAPTRPAVVLDPFGGTGTTALVAKALGRIGISVDMSADYCRLAQWRTTDPGQMAAALQVEKPELVSPDQLDLFSEVTA